MARVRLFLKESEVGTIVECLRYSILSTQEYQRHPSAEFKRQRIETLEAVQATVRKYSAKRRNRV